MSLSVEDLSHVFSDMKVSDIPTNDTSKKTCKTRFRNMLRRWKRGTRPGLFRGACTANPDGCMFNIRVYKKAGIYRHAFNKEVKVWTHLKTCKSAVTPKLHDTFFCKHAHNSYGFIVSDMWSGDLTSFWKMYPESRTHVEMDKLHTRLKQLVSDLHSCGYTHGDLTTRAIVFFCPSVPTIEACKFHLINFKCARKTTRTSAQEKDYRDLQQLMDEVSLVFRTGNVHTGLPIQLQTDMAKLL